MNGTKSFSIFLLQLDKKQLSIGCFHTSYCLFAKCFLRKQSLHCNISLFRALPYSGLCFQISVYKFTDCHMSVHDIYKQIQICVYSNNKVTSSILLLKWYLQFQLFRYFHKTIAIRFVGDLLRRTDTHPTSLLSIISKVHCPITHNPVGHRIVHNIANLL